LRLYVSQPKYLREREPLERGVRDPRSQVFKSNLLDDGLALRSRSTVAPKKRRANDIVVAVEKNGSVHLAREADSIHGSLLTALLPDDSANRFG
jgi:hypothetical protein